MTPKLVVGVGWYSEDQWTMLKLLADDRETLDATYQEWVEGFEKALKGMQEQGNIAAVRVPVDIEALRQWGRERGKRLDGSSRAEYVRDMVNNTVGGV